MSLQKSFVVDGTQVTALQPSAVKQDELLGLLSKNIYMAFQVCAKTGNTLGVKECAFMLMTLEKDIKSRIAEILTESAFLTNGTSQIQVSVKDFQGRMVAWNTLLAELLIWNLSDFFDYLSADLQQGRAEKSSETQE